MLRVDVTSTLCTICFFYLKPVKNDYWVEMLIFGDLSPKRGQQAVVLSLNFCPWDIISKLLSGCEYLNSSECKIQVYLLLFKTKKTVALSSLTVAVLFPDICSESPLTLSFSSAVILLRTIPTSDKSEVGTFYVFLKVHCYLTAQLKANKKSCFGGGIDKLNHEPQADGKNSPWWVLCLSPNARVLFKHCTTDLKSSL